MGFFTWRNRYCLHRETSVAIPFRVGWGFSPEQVRVLWIVDEESQSLSGWDGVFHKVWGWLTQLPVICRNPFQGGMGFFTAFGSRL